MSAPKALPQWEFGYWFWQGSSEEIKATAPVDTLYFQAGTIQESRYSVQSERWSVYAHLPESLPPARSYWVVIRMDAHTLPDAATAQMLGRQLGRLEVEAAERNLKITGLQLDIDCPTRALREYAGYLRAVRKEMPAGWQLSITALLDWFRAGTAVGQVVEAVDEFVPQFYDLQNPGTVAGGLVVAAPVQAAKWAPVFGKFGRRFRIGLSTFGRSRFLAAGDGGRAVSFWDLRPFAVATNSAFVLETAMTPAKEIVLRYRAERDTSIGYQKFDAGTTLEFVLSTPEAIAAAVAEVRQMGEYCGGVLFFRWPGPNESMAAAPDEVLHAAGAAEIPAKRPTLQVEDRGCAAVHCATLSLNDLPSLPPTAVRYVITSTADLEYFLPYGGTPVRMAGRRRLELTMPAYIGRMDVPLGRAVTAERASYSLEVKP